MFSRFKCLILQLVITTIHRAMVYAIIAAGDGSRLQKEGISVPKPLVEVGGECLIDRLIRIFMDNGASEIAVICNDKTARVASHLAMLQRDGLCGRRLPLRFKAMSTPSSMHSFHEIGCWLRSGEPFILTTVDTVFDEGEFARFVRAFGCCGSDGLMGVTSYIEDEKPLYVDVEMPSMRISGYYDKPHDCRYISAGIYGLRPAALDILDRCIVNGEARMRNYQRALLREGQRLQAFAFGKVIDIDHLTDIERARQLFAVNESKAL